MMRKIYKVNIFLVIYSKIVDKGVKRMYNQKRYLKKWRFYFARLNLAGQVILWTASSVGRAFDS